MGEYADYMLNGDDCQYCGEHLGTGPGYPRSCISCRDDDEDAPSKKPKVKPEAIQKAEALTHGILQLIQNDYGAQFNPEIRRQFAPQIVGLLKSLEVQNGKLIHVGLLHTIHHNKHAQVEAALRKQKRIDKNGK